jgi:hypothetical protein
MLGLPNLDALMAGFQADFDGMREDLKAIRNLLEQLLALEETNVKGKK